MPNDKPRLYELLRQEHEMMFGGVPCPPGAVAACGLYPSMRGARETPPGGSVHERRACKSVHGVPLLGDPDFGPIESPVDTLRRRVWAMRCPLPAPWAHYRSSFQVTETIERHDFSKHPQCSDCLNTGWSAGRVGERPCARCPHGDKVREIIAAQDDVVDAAVVAWDAVRPLAPTEMLDALAAGIAPVRRESTPVETAMVYCALPWCGREHEVRVKERRRNVVVYECETLHCSDRCREYDERRGVVVARFATYTDAMARAYRNGTLPPHAQTEWRWAEAKRDDELAPIERQFRSLRVEP